MAEPVPGASDGVSDVVMSGRAIHAPPGAFLRAARRAAVPASPPAPAMRTVAYDAPVPSTAKPISEGRFTPPITCSTGVRAPPAIERTTTTSPENDTSSTSWAKTCKTSGGDAATRER